jgi:D-alanyl-D-alanine carboxypeptidase
LKKITAIFVLSLFCISFSFDAFAKSRSFDDWTNTRYAAFIVDSDTGKILHQENANQTRYPASLTKMMTLYLLFESMKKGKVSMNTSMKISAVAASRPQTNLSLKGGQTIRVRDAIPALIIRSANDVSVVVAEHLGRTESNFADIMTARARQLGMTRTVFKNANGLPNAKQHSTAKDLAILSIALRKHYPQYAYFFKQKQFTYNGRTYKTHNNLVNTYSGADGMKTGYINASGFNVATSVNRREGNIIGVVMGGRTSRSRDDQMTKLLNEAFTTMAMLKNPRRANYSNAHIFPVSKKYREEGGYARYLSMKEAGGFAASSGNRSPQVMTSRSNEGAPMPIEKPSTNASR